MTKRLPFLAILLVLLLCVVFSRNGFSGGSPNPTVGKPAPDLEFKSLDGKSTYHLKDFRGQVVVLDFWQTWCGPCIGLMPHMSELSQRLKGRGLKVFGVTTETRGDVEKLLDSIAERPTYEMVLDPTEKAWEAFEISPIPASVVIGRDGVVRYYDYGMSPDAGLLELEQAIKLALDAK